MRPLVLLEESGQTTGFLYKPFPYLPYPHLSTLFFGMEGSAIQIVSIDLEIDILFFSINLAKAGERSTNCWVPVP